MAGRPPVEDKKVREAIYLKPDLLQWLQKKAEAEKRTVSAVVSLLVEQARASEN